MSSRTESTRSSRTPRDGVDVTASEMFRNCMQTPTHKTDIYHAWRRSLAGGLSSTDALSWSIVLTLWLNCLPWVNQPGQLSLPSIQGRKIGSNPCITEIETTKRQTTAEYGCMSAGQSPLAWAWTMVYRLYARSVCNTKWPLQLWHAAL